MRVTLGNNGTKLYVAELQSAKVSTDRFVRGHVHADAPLAVSAVSATTSKTLDEPIVCAYQYTVPTELKALGVLGFQPKKPADSCNHAPVDVFVNSRPWLPGRPSNRKSADAYCADCTGDNTYDTGAAFATVAFELIANASTVAVVYGDLPTEGAEEVFDVPFIEALVALVAVPTLEVFTTQVVLKMTTNV